MRIALLNEEIKKIQKIAEGISLTAVNAALVARQAGDKAAGFRVVARELRTSSDRMAGAMGNLANLIYRLVFSTARGQNLVRRMKSLSVAAMSSEHAHLSIAVACQKSKDDLDECLRSIRVQAHELQHAVSRTGKQCAGGVVIARAATIEAAYGGVMRPLLRQIAMHLEAKITKMNAGIRQVQGQEVHV